MSNSTDYDPDEQLLSPSPYGAHPILYGGDSPDFDLSSKDPLSDGDPLQNNNHSSPQQSTVFSPKISLDNFEDFVTENETIDFSLTTQLMEKLRIIAQPRAFYRERYCSETDPSKHRAQRFIRADDDGSNIYEYPTIEIPQKWRDFNRNLYIRVTLVTVFTDQVRVVCIHPYAIDTQENDVLREPNKNSLYFPLTRGDILTSRKSFRISRKKMIQNDLRSYGPLHVFDMDQHDIQRVGNLHDAKQIIDTYQLWTSQLIFTVAEQISNNAFPIPRISTQVTSQIMCDKTVCGTKGPSVNDALCPHIFEDDTVKCTPRKGDWHGGDDIMMTIPKLDRRNGFDIYFDYGPTGKIRDLKVSFVDTKTIFFQTPSCMMREVKHNCSIPIIVIQNNLVIAHVEFVYLASIRITSNPCLPCHNDLLNNNFISNKRPCISEPWEADGGELLAEQMSQLTTEEKPIETNHQPNNDGMLMTDKDSRFDKYLGQLQEAVVDFVRTSNPSRLFRRTRLLIAKCEENPPPLDDAIRYGHIDLALKLIEQAVDMSATNGLLDRENTDGQIPLLLAAKYNQWILIEAILQKRLDLLEKSDKNSNNILHLLANAAEHEVNQTIQNVLTLIPNDVRTKLLQKKNKDNQTPIEIAQTKDNSHLVDLFEKF